MPSLETHNSTAIAKHMYHTVKAVPESHSLCKIVTLFHFLSLLFLELCICVQNNILHVTVLVRGNTVCPVTQSSIIESAVRMELPLPSISFV